jgi:FtsH-binding integral membrane protein
MGAQGHRGSAWIPALIGQAVGIDALMDNKQDRPIWVVLTRTAVVIACLSFSWVAWTLKDSFKPASDHSFVTMFAIMACIGVPPLVAIGALFGRARLAAVIGAVCFVIFAAWVLFALSNATDL